jgi:hypothetical protein
MSRRFQGEGFKHADSLRFAVWIGLMAIGLHAQPARADLPGLETIGDLEEMVEEAWNSAPIAPPGNEPYGTHLGVFLFGSEMDTNFLAALLPETHGTYVLYPVEVVETNTSLRQRLFLNLTNGIVWTASLSATNYPAGWIEQKYGSPPGWLSGTNLTQWVAERDPIRHRVRLDLLSAGDEPAYLEALTNAVLQQTGEEPPVNLCEVYSNQLAIVAHREGAGGIELYLHAPTGVVALAVLRSTNLLEGCGWRLQTTLLHTVNPFRWLDTGPEMGAFVTFGNAWTDSDGDGLSDILESYVYGTDPNHRDSDGDGWSDGYEVFTTGTHPWGLNDRDGDDVGDGFDPEPDTANPFVELTVTTNFPAWTWPGQSFTMTPALPTNAVQVTGIQLYQEEQTSVQIQAEQYCYRELLTTNPVVNHVLSKCLTGRAIPDAKTGIFTMTPIDGTSSGGSGTITWTYLVVIKIVPDYTRDGIINENDELLGITNKIFRFWINDDVDEEGDYSGDSGIPGQTQGNHSDDLVNGHGDLIDFFPIWFDLHGALTNLPPDADIQVKLRQTNSALKAVYTDLTKEQANSFLKVSRAVYGPTFDMDAYLAPTFQINTSGVTLSSAFLQRIRDNPDKGVLLLEGTAETTAPLVLEIWNDTRMIGETKLSLDIRGVEAMYRWHNLRVSPSIPDRVGNPTNRPDAVCINVDVFLAHGFRVLENEARAWGSEFFKRLYQEGMNARFHAVTWSADTGAGVSYEENVNNAFLTASIYAERVNAIKAANGSDIVVIGHSLGCMLTSAAIADGGMQADKFFALNGAVPAEAFDPAMADEQTNAQNRLLHPDWRDYNANTWSANWYQLFTNSAAFPNDDRATLTWRGRLTNAAPVLYNYWSSGDEVLEIAAGDEDLNLLSGIEWDWELNWWPVSANPRRYSWHKQALFKGRSGLYGTTWAGWGFWESQLPLLGKVYSMAEANALDDDTLRTEPVFRHNPEEMFVSNIVRAVQNDILARGIPELSFPIGYTNLTVANCAANLDLNMDPSLRRDDAVWPQRDIDFSDDGTRPNRWLHTDLLNLPHYYTHKLYGRLVLEGEMK